MALRQQQGVTEVVGISLDQTRKFRDVRHSGRAAVVVDNLALPNFLTPRPGSFATLFAPAPALAAPALVAVLGRPRAALLAMLAEPLATVELARRARVTPSAVSQHLQVLHAGGFVARARAGRQVLYRRTPVGDSVVASGERSNFADPG